MKLIYDVKLPDRGSSRKREYDDTLDTFMMSGKPLAMLDPEDKAMTTMYNGFREAISRRGQQAEVEIMQRGGEMFLRRVE